MYNQNLISKETDQANYIKSCYKVKKNKKGMQSSSKTYLTVYADMVITEVDLILKSKYLI